jgi:hypothetical protein
VATKKQRRRRDKERRHEYEYEYVDEDGRPVEVEEPEPAKPKGGGKAPAPKTQATTRGGRRVEPPSWRRVARRAGIFAPLMLIVLYLLKPKDASLASIVFQGVILIAIFIPFSYLMDTLLWRSYQKRTGQGGNEPRAKGK